MPMTFDIAPATPNDVDTILGFIRELADYEHALDAVQANAADLHAALFCDNPRVWSDICRSDGRAVGFVLYFFSFSTWVGRQSLFLEDLYVTPAHRGQGAGKALFRHLAQVAIDRLRVLREDTCR